MPGVRLQKKGNADKKPHSCKTAGMGHPTSMAKRTATQRVMAPTLTIVTSRSGVGIPALTVLDTIPKIYE